MTGSFSLHRLPQKELSTVLLCMTHIDRISYSLCSQRCKNAVVGLNLRAPELRLEFSADFTMNLMFDAELTISTLRQNVVAVNLYDKQLVFVNSAYQNSTVSWIYKCLSCREWLAHCMEIFHTESCESAILYSAAENICFEQIRYILEKLQTRLIRINSDERVELVHKILPLHLQCKELAININSFGRAGSMENCRKALIQNTDNVCFEGHLDEAALHVKLDDLLLSNASQLALIVPKLFSKDVNRFLKLWMHGANRRLKTLKLIIVNEPFFNEEEIMRGIHHTNISEQDFDEKMRAHNYHRSFIEMMNGGFNIISRDGREASIGLTRVFETSMVQFFVWN